MFVCAQPPVVVHVSSVQGCCRCSPGPFRPCKSPWHARPRAGLPRCRSSRSSDRIRADARCRLQFRPWHWSETVQTTGAPFTQDPPLHRSPWCTRAVAAGRCVVGGVYPEVGLQASSGRGCCRCVQGRPAGAARSGRLHRSQVLPSLQPSHWFSWDSSRLLSSDYRSRPWHWSDAVQTTAADARRRRSVARREALRRTRCCVPWHAGARGTKPVPTQRSSAGGCCHRSSGRSADGAPPLQASSVVHGLPSSQDVPSSGALRGTSRRRCRYPRAGVAVQRAVTDPAAELARMRAATPSSRLPSSHSSPGSSRPSPHLHLPAAQ